ncbi:polysaccharide deacetylase family protein [Dyella solisilvae]|uniref:Polysaccharide deacetylase family protein n=1 Tax=Dyella solisilvae TaxID=1920168 RepID=A0A370K344_9GAMM|nr:polysaccharide deacetylase family protein [Dyella solisilvae]RDI97049.1 polysaccharide deacetylase family protein [Dyella solisilvae]
MNMRPRKQQLLRWLPDRLLRTHASAHAGARYLTFDDGPDPEHTPRLLDLLAAHGVHASFFLVGHRAEQHPTLVERMVDEGHVIANHSWSHWSFKPMSLHQQVDEFRRTDQLLRQFDGEPQHWLRTPQGYLDARLLLHCARHGRSIVYWSYDSMDYQKPATDALVARLRAQPPQPGDIVLMHDDSDLATDALGVLLPEWLAQGHHFRALPRKEP